MQVADWLRTIGLEQYAPAFEQNAVGFDLLPTLTADDLKDLGVAMVGHRRRILDAIAALHDGGGGAPAPPKPQAAGTAAERRQLTVIFCDLVGSTALSGQLDPEDLREVVSRCQTCVAQTVRAFNGFVAKYRATVCWCTLVIREPTRTTLSRRCALALC